MSWQKAFEMVAEGIILGRGTGYILGKKNDAVRNIETVFVCLGILCFDCCGGSLFWVCFLGIG